MQPFVSWHKNEKHGEFAVVLNFDLEELIIGSILLTE